MAHSRKKDFSKNYRIIGICILAIVCIIVSFLVFRPKPYRYPDYLSLYLNGRGYYLEVSQDGNSLTKGLSDRNDLCFNCGMLFVFDRADKHSFWMKDTHIPLDIIWLNSDKQIIKIINAAKTDSEKFYTPNQPAKYVIELNANESLKLNLKIGDTINLP